MTTKLEILLSYTLRGWPLFPLHYPLSNEKCSCGKPDCTSLGKHPRTGHGFKDAKKNEGFIREWHKTWPNGNYGMPTGQISGVVVLDIDGDKGGEDSLAQLIAENGSLPITPESLTGNGRHILFKAPKEKIGNRANIKPGLDFRGDGGYIVVPPSRHRNGKTYEWEVEHHPDDIELAEMPDWLLKLVQNPKGESLQSQSNGNIRPVKNGKGILKAACDRISQTKEGYRNDTLNKEAFTLGGYLPHGILKREEVETALLTAAQATGLKDDEIKSAIKSGLDAGFLKPLNLSQNGIRKPIRLEIGSNVEIAEYVLEKIQKEHGEIVYDSAKVYYCGKDNVWRPFSDTIIRRYIRELDGHSYNSTRIKLSQHKIKDILAIFLDIIKDEGFFQAAPKGIAFKDTFFFIDQIGNAQTEELQPNHQVRFQFDVPIENWQKDGKIPEDSLLSKLLKGCFKEDEDQAAKILFLSELAGCVLFGLSHIVKKMVLFIGPTARNGKSTILTLYRSLLPEWLIACIPISKLNDEKMLAQLCGVLLNTADEISSIERVGSDTLKALITGDPITARSAYKDPLTFVSQAMLIYAGNTLPRVSDGLGPAIQRRVVILEFNRAIPITEIIPDLAEKIIRNEMPLLLSWAIDGAIRIIKQGGFNIPPSSLNAMTEWVDEADPVAAWLNTVKTESSDDRVLTADAYTHFQNWANRQGMYLQKVPSQRTWKDRLKQSGFVPKPHREGVKVFRGFNFMKLTEGS